MVVLAAVVTSTITTEWLMCSVKKIPADIGFLLFLVKKKCVYLFSSFFARACVRACVLLVSSSLLLCQLAVLHQSMCISLINVIISSRCSILRGSRDRISLLTVLVALVATFVAVTGSMKSSKKAWRSRAKRGEEGN